MVTKGETVYERGVATGVYTREQRIEIVVFYSHEDEAWGAMFAAMPSLSAFGDTPELALKEFGIMLQGAADSGLEVSALAKAKHISEE